MRYSLCYLSIAYIYAYIYVLVSFHPSIISAHDIPVQDQPHLSSDPTHVKPTPFDIEPLPHPVPVGNPSPFQLKQNPDSTPVENPSPFVLEPLPLPVPVDPVPIITQLMDYNFTDPVVEIPIPILLNSTTLNTTSPVNVAGNGVPGYAGDGTNNTVVTEIRFPNAVVLDSSQNIFIADTFNHVIRMVSNATGVISTYAGMALSGVPDCLSGCLATKSVLESPKYVTFDIFGNLYVSDSGNHVVKKIAKDTTNITVVAGVLGQYWGSPGDGGLATAATLISPYGIAFDSHNNLYISDISANFIRKVDGITGMISTFAGLYDGLHFSFTNASSDTLGTNALYPAVEVALSGPAGMQIDQNDQLFIADTYNNVVRVVSSFLTSLHKQCSFLSISIL